VNASTFNMNGGTITDNNATRWGGGVYVNSGIFTMSGGNISGNNATTNGGGVDVWYGTFNMTGGTITNNTASGTNNYGGGVYVNSGTFTMTGGTITNNTASGTNINFGGGVCVYGNSGTFTMTGGTISSNTARDGGGGVYVCWEGIFNMNGGNISGNNAQDGGGVYVTNSGTFNMSGGTISDNIAMDRGGVYVNSGTFNMTGGTISGNNAAFAAGGVYLYSSIFNITGSAKVDADNDVCLYSGTFITVTGDLEAGAGAQNITPAFIGIGDKVVEYGSVDINNWSSNFALNPAWIQDYHKDLAESGTNLILSDNFTVKYYLTDSNMTPYYTNISVPYEATLTPPADPTRTGYTFSSWNQGSSSGIPWNFEDGVKANTYLYANWTENPTQVPTSNSNGDGGNDGNNADYGPVSLNGTFTTEDGNLTLYYPAGSNIMVTVFKDYFNGAEKPPGISYLVVYDVHSTADSGTSVTLVFRVNASLLEAKGLTPEDISILHYYDGEWHQMTIKSIDLVDGAYQFTVTSTHTSPFMIAYNVDGTWFPLEGATTPTSTPTTNPTETVPTSTTTPTPTEPTSSPVPLVGIIAGLGAAGLLLRRRK